MRKHTIDWTGIGAEIAAGVGAGALFVFALITLFGPMANALAKLS